MAKKIKLNSLQNMIGKTYRNDAGTTFTVTALVKHRQELKLFNEYRKEHFVLGTSSDEKAARLCATVGYPLSIFTENFKIIA